MKKMHTPQRGHKPPREHPEQPFMPTNAAEMVNANRIMDAIQSGMLRVAPKVDGITVLQSRETVGVCLMLAAWSATRFMRGKTAEEKRAWRREFLRIAMLVYDDGVEQGERTTPVLTHEEFETMRRTQGSA